MLSLNFMADITQRETNQLFPVFLKLESLRILIVGGGEVGVEKLRALLSNSPSANISLVATEINEDIRFMAAEHLNIKLITRPYRNNDLDHIDIAIVAINDPLISKKIASDARVKGVLLNVADQPDLCDFYLGSVVKKGNLKIAISTNGKSPTIAKRLKETFTEMLPAELDEVLDNMQNIRKKLNGNFADKVAKLNEVTKILANEKLVEKDKKWRRIATYSLVAFGLMLIGHFILSYVPFKELATGADNIYRTLDKNFPWMVLAGFVAQLVDGALGMGYGVTSASILLSTGISPAAISGSIHTAEMFASGASGYSHYRFGNVNKKLFKTLVIPGVVGAIAGAFLLTYLGKQYQDWIRPVMAFYTLFLGVKIMLNAFRSQQAKKKFKNYRALAGLGGFLDSFGGGGWGPIVTTTLITKGRSPRFVIGTVSLTEFFVTLASAFTFFTLIGVSHWQTIIALIIGGFLAAPIAAKLAGKLPRKTSFILLGVLVIVWSIKILVNLL